jgi:ABC-type multidrug transport system ATPase subunit
MAAGRGARDAELGAGSSRRFIHAPPPALPQATSALDSITERRIQATLAERRAGRTVVVVAHRLSTIMDADHIVVMERGEVAEAGTHEALLAAPGSKYAELWARQQEGGGGGPSGSSRAASSAALASLAEGSGGADGGQA